MNSKTPQEEGIEFEERFADLFDAKLQPGSGNQWFAKLDVDGVTILWSLKRTTKNSLKLTPAILDEAIEHASGIGSAGALPGWAGSVGDLDLVVMRADDMALLFQENTKLKRQKRTEARRARAKVPIALRHAEEDDEQSG